MAQHPDYPGVSPMVTRHGKTLWRYRRKGKEAMMPGEPHTPEFDAAYSAIIEGRALPNADVIRHPKAAAPRSLKAAYQLLKQEDEWLALDPLKTQATYARTIERILDLPAGNNSTIGDGPFADLERAHVKNILKHFPTHMARTALICMKKLTMIALDQEWIKHDPTYRLKKNTPTQGHHPWPADIMAKFEAKWPIGSRPRTAYALALWLGNRVSDVARLSWSHYTVKQIMIDGTLCEYEGFEFVQWKGRKKKGEAMFLPMTPMLATELAPLERDPEGPVLKKQLKSKKRGWFYADITLTIAMAEWCEKAGIPPGYTMHGLRKSLGVKLAEADASTRQIMDTLGHRNIAYAELYTRKASQARLAIQAMDKVSAMETARRKPRLIVSNKK
ncbi:site-specific integrase [Sinorhizobium meliloti]|nr:site-specific integrase [Sinorhizobium meliloti]PST24761.1 site-specific integrase [Mesorhizobium loti]MBP2466525.1 integrase [Sinorhizobium meliloti]MDE3769287.1 site-specific integrase [Sinorhizobium meliloti]MDE3777556.1 site-specific integrase [Sinorhizobium meliloti]MDE3783515.1 site-specific integrase [Sinorhizobium meliloti]